MIAQRYEYRKNLGKGGSGSVFLAYDYKLDKYWAVKELEGICDYRKNIELRLLKTISCRMFPRIVDVVAEKEKIYLVMDYIEGESLRQRMKRGALTEAEVLKIALQLAEGIQYLHQMSPQMLYMDCKPDNIMMSRDGEIKLIDLGSVYICQTKQESGGRQKISGTRFYAPLEQREAKREEIGVTTDIYAVGMTLTSLLLGKEISIRQKGHFHIRNYNRKISKGMDYIIRKCTERDTGKRFQTMEELIYALHHIKRINRREQCRWGLDKTIDVILKNALAFGSIYFLKKYASCQGMETVIIAVILFLLLLILSFQTKKEILEVQKNLYLGTGKNIIFSIAMIIFMGISFSVSGTAKSSPESRNAEALDLQIYDKQFRNILIRKGYTWETEDDIILAIKNEDLSEKNGYIEIFYVPEGEATKSYCFCVKRKNHECYDEKLF